MSEEQDIGTKGDLLESAWGIIANASGGDWSKASDQWREAAERWRDDYFASLNEPVPLLTAYSELEVFVAGAISTAPPMDTRHPQFSLPLARRALEATAAWEPTADTEAERV